MKIKSRHYPKVSGRLHACRLFTPGERATGTQWIACRTGPCQSGRCGDEKNHFLQPEIEPRSLSHSAHSRLSYQLCCEIHVS
jgi:hypothetical protein